MPITTDAADVLIFAAIRVADGGVTVTLLFVTAYHDILSMPRLILSIIVITTLLIYAYRAATPMHCRTGYLMLRTRHEILFTRILLRFDV